MYILKLKNFVTKHQNENLTAPNLQDILQRQIFKLHIYIDSLLREEKAKKKKWDEMLKK